MNWIEIALTVEREAADAVADTLQAYCHQGVSIEREGILPDLWDDGDEPPISRLTVRGYFVEDGRAEATRQQIDQALAAFDQKLFFTQPVYNIVHEEDWAEAWKAHYHPVKIGRRLLIRPEWIEVNPEPDDVVIALDPGMAFGTGTHMTTQLCLLGIDDLVQPGMTVLDLGCGSGILAIAAAKLGAARILAVDNDPIAVEATLENARRNGVAEQIIAEEGSVETVTASGQQFDLAVVNILARIIIAMCDHNLGETVRPGGKAIFSGIILPQAEEVEAALRKTGLNPTGRRVDGDWVLIECERPN